MPKAHFTREAASLPQAHHLPDRANIIQKRPFCLPKEAFLLYKSAQKVRNRGKPKSTPAECTKKGCVTQLRNDTRPGFEDMPGYARRWIVQ